MTKYSTIPQMFYNVINSNLEKNIFNYKKGGEWVGLTGEEIKLKVESISSGMRYFGIIEHNKVAILSNTSYKWALCDYAILCNGSTTVTV